jgi:hypothetical protein
VSAQLPADLRGLDDAFGAVHCIGMQAHELIRGLQEIQASMNGVGCGTVTSRPSSV